MTCPKRPRDLRSRTFGHPRTWAPSWRRLRSNGPSLHLCFRSWDNRRNRLRRFTTLRAALIQVAAEPVMLLAADGAADHVYAHHSPPFGLDGVRRDIHGTPSKLIP